VWGPDNVEERLELAGEIIELARRARNLSLELAGHAWRLVDLLEMGNGNEADREIEDYAALAEQLGTPHFVSYAFMFRAMQALLRGDFTEAEDLAQRSRRAGEQVEDGNVLLSHHVQMAMLRALQGRPAECEAYLELVTHRLAGDRGLVHRTCFLALAGDRAGIEQALPRLRRALEQSPPAFRVVALTWAAFLTAEAGASEEGAAVYDLLRPYEGRLALSGRDGVVCLGPVAYYLGMLAASLSHYDDAARHFEVALEMARRIGSQPYCALAEAGYGTMLVRRGTDADRPRARQLLAHALKTAKELGMGTLQKEILAAQQQASSDSAAAAAPVEASQAHAPAVFRVEGEYWSIDFGGKTVRLKDARGLRYLRTLLAAPGREFHVLDLAAGTAPSSRGPGGAGHQASALHAGEADVILDSAAKAAYRARIEELRGDIEEAEDNNDLERASRARAEVDFIVSELARAVGLGGRDRGAASAAERARSNIGKALRASLKRISEVHPTLGTHLETTVRTGYFCSYKPDPRLPVVWQT
jgi:sugar phosphate isomerase/epimerase